MKPSEKHQKQLISQPVSYLIVNPVEYMDAIYPFIDKLNNHVIKYDKNFIPLTKDREKLILTKEYDEGIAILSLHNAHIIGVLVAGIKTQYSFCHIRHLYVEEQYRSMGIGQNLLDKMEQKCRELGIDKIVLQTTVHEDNLAMRFYEKNGFKSRCLPDINKIMTYYYLKKVAPENRIAE